MVSRFAFLLLILVSVNASLTGLKNIVPTLPNTIIKSENSQCRQDSIRLQLGLENMTLWAQQSKLFLELCSVIQKYIYVYIDIDINNFRKFCDE